MEDYVGLGFRPTEVELVGYYLPNKIQGKTWLVEWAINEVNICDFDPWNLRFQSKIKSKDRVWYFFSHRKNKYGTGDRQNRKTPSGKWKITGVPTVVMDDLGIWCGIRGKIGHKRCLEFVNSVTDRIDDEWVIHEYHNTVVLPEYLRTTYVICRLEYKGDDMSILSTYAIDPSLSFVANMTNSEGSVVNQSRQGNSGSYNTYSDSSDMQQSVSAYAIDPTLSFVANMTNCEGSVVNQSRDYNTYSEDDSTNHGQHLNGYFNMLDKVPFSYDYYEVDPYTGQYLLIEWAFMQENRNVCIPKKPVTGHLTDDSSNSDTDSMFVSDNSSGTDGLGNLIEPYHTPIDDIPSLYTINPLHNFEAQEQPKLHLQGKEKGDKYAGKRMRVGNG